MDELIEGSEFGEARGLDCVAEKDEMRDRGCWRIANGVGPWIR